MIKLIEIINKGHITQGIFDNLYFDMLDADSDNLLEIFNKYGYEDYLENYTQPGRNYTFYEYLKDKGNLNKVYDELLKLKSKYNASL